MPGKGKAGSGETTPASGKQRRRPRGDGSIYWREDIKRWTAMVDLGRRPDGKRDRRSISADPEKYPMATAAKEHLRAEMARLRRESQQGTLPAADSNITLEKFIPIWLKEHVWAGRLSPVTAESYERYARLYVLPSLAKVKVQKLDRLQIQRLINELHRQGKGTQTLQLTRTVISSMMNRAVDWGYRGFNPAQRLDMPEPPLVDDDEAAEVLTPDQARRLLFTATWYPEHILWVLMLGGAMRKGEAVGLRWRSVDLEHGVIKVREALKALKKEHGGLVSGKPKSKKTREVPIPGFARELLAEHRKRLEERLRKAGRIMGPGELVAQTVDCRPFHPRQVNEYLDQALKRLDIPHISPHDLRHSCASLLRLLGVDPLMIQQILGHASLDTTRIYMHTTPEEFAGAGDKLDGLLNPKRRQDVGNDIGNGAPLPN